MVVGSRLHIVDVIIKLVLFAFTCAGTMFATSGRFVDSQIMPKWLILFAGVILLVSYLILRFLFFSNKKYTDNNSVETFAVGLVIIIVFGQALYGVLQFFNLLYPTTAFQVTGSFDNPAGFAASLCVAFPVFIGAFLKSGKLWRWIIGSMAALVAAGVVFSASRAGMLSLAVVLLFFSMRHLKLRKKIKWIFLPLLLSAIVIGLYFLKKDSADGRLLIWKCSLSMINDKWLTGHGTGGFQAHYMDYQADYFKNNPDSPYEQLADNVQRPFNEYIRLVVDYGMVGLLLLVVCVGYLLGCYFKHPSLENKVAISCWLTVGVFSFFSYPLLYPFVWFILLYSTCLLTRKDRANLLAYISSRNQRIFVLPVLCLLVYSGVQVYHRLQAEWEWKKAISYKSECAINYYPQLAKVLINDCYFLYNYAVVLFENERFKESFAIALQCRKYWVNYELEILLGDICKNLQMYQKAESYYLQASMMCPCRFYPLNLLYDLYQEMGDGQKALEVAARVRKKPVKVKSLIVTQIKYKMKQALLKSGAKESY